MFTDEEKVEGADQAPAGDTDAPKTEEVSV